MWGWSLVVTVMAVGSVVVVPADARATGSATIDTFELPTALVDPSTPGGKLEAGRTAPRVHVLLPPGYHDHPDRRYPVLWLLHGANGGTDTWLPGIAELAAGFPGIIVMPDGGLFGMYMDWWNGGARGAPAWATFHLAVLRRTIEERYRIRPERRWHAIGGISMGGQGALRYAAMLPGYFGTVATFSAAAPDIQAVEVQGAIGLLAAAGQTYGATYEAIFGSSHGEYAEGYNPRALVPNLGHTRIYLSSGWGIHCPEDPIPATFAIDTITEAGLHLQQAPFSVAARRAGAQVTAVTTCGSHTFGVWDRAIPAALEWGLFAPVPEAPERWRYRTIATSGEMWGLRFRFDEPPPAVVDFERFGPILTATGSGTVVIDGPIGCSVRLTLPVEQQLPAACLRSG